MQTGLDLRNLSVKTDLQSFGSAEKAASERSTENAASLFSARLDDALVPRQPEAIKRQAEARHVPLVPAKADARIAAKSDAPDRAPSAHQDRPEAMTKREDHRKAQAGNRPDRAERNEQDAVQDTLSKADPQIEAKADESEKAVSEVSIDETAQAVKTETEASASTEEAAPATSTDVATVIAPQISSETLETNAVLVALAPTAAALADQAAASPVTAGAIGEISEMTPHMLAAETLAAQAAEAAKTAPVEGGDALATASTAEGETATGATNAATAKPAATTQMLALPAGEAVKTDPTILKQAVDAAAAKQGDVKVASETAQNVKAAALEAPGAAHRAPAAVERLNEVFAHNPQANAIAQAFAAPDAAKTFGALMPGVEMAARPTPLQMLPIEIGMQAVRGVTNFQIRLDPAELGRVEVKLEINEQGEVKANLIVDRVETLQMLRRDASSLQQALEQAGLKQSGDGALNFSLRGDGQQGQGQKDGQGRPGADHDDAMLKAQLEHPAMRRVMIPNSSLDLMI